MKVRRDRYLEQLKHRMHNGLVKIVTGVRRCGKSYLLSVLFKEWLEEQGVDGRHIVEVPLDRDEFRGCRDALSLGEWIRARLPGDGKWTYVFIDEVQLARKILPLRKSGDFFRKMVVTGGTEGLRVSEEGIWRVGVVPFLLDEGILDRALSE